MVSHVAATLRYAKSCHAGTFLGSHRQRKNRFLVQMGVVHNIKLGAMYCGKPRRRATRQNKMGVIIKVTLDEHIYWNLSPFVTLRLSSIDYSIVFSCPYDHSRLLPFDYLIGRERGRTLIHRCQRH